MRASIVRRICVSKKPLFSLQKRPLVFLIFSLPSAKTRKGALHPHFEERGNKFAQLVNDLKK